MNSLGPNELIEDVDKPLELSSRILAQAEGAKLDFYTINFARLVCRDIHVAAQGQRLYNHCLTNLPIHRSGDPRFQFGWGEVHILRNLGVQLYEYEHLLLASALGEYFSEDYAAAVLSALGDCFEDELRPKPHMSSFKNFVHGANGIMGCSDFPLAVDDQIRRNPYRSCDDGLPFAKQPQETISVIKLAEALCMLGELKNGGPSELTFAGGDVLGWFSAFADMCLGMDVTLMDEDGKELHRANPNGGKRLKLQFMPMGASPSVKGGSAIWLREESVGQKVSFIWSPLHTGRSTVDLLAIRAFGAAFHTLNQTESKAFANALGGSARTWEIAAKSDTLGIELISLENKNNAASLGAGLISTWTNWFPEIRHLQGRMERALKLDRPAAERQCDESCVRLESLCACYICSPTNGPEERPSNLPREGFCLPTLMETFIMLGLALSRVALTPNLYPSRAGVLSMYKSQMRKRLDLKKLAIDRHSPERHQILFGEDWNATFPKRLANVIALFSGSWPKRDMPENMMGMSHEGICAYSMKLERGDKRAAHPDDFVIRVVTGSINWRQKTLRRVCSGPVKSGDEVDMTWDSIQCDHFKGKLYVK